MLKNRLIPTKIRNLNTIIGLILLISILGVTLMPSFSTSEGNTSTNVESPQTIPLSNIKNAESTIQFSVNVAYAYVGPAPINNSYFDKKFNATMYLSRQYPSKVYLNITRNSGTQPTNCEAEMEVYGIKIAADKGPTEYYAYGVGTNFNQTFSRSDKSTLYQYVNCLVDHGLYRAIVANFRYNWTENTSMISLSTGSYGQYTTNPNPVAGLFSEGKPSSISVSVFRIGYLTINRGSPEVFRDAINNTNSVAKLTSYENGFLYNNLVPDSNLPNINLFKPSS